MIPRGNTGHSSSNYRNIITKNIEEKNHFEIKDYVNIL